MSDKKISTIKTYAFPRKLIAKSSKVQIKKFNYLKLSRKVKSAEDQKVSKKVIVFKEKINQTKNGKFIVS